MNLDQPVVIIERDFGTNNLYCSLIDRIEGFAVVAAYANGSDAIAKLTKDRPSLVVFSIYLDDEHCLSTLEHLRKNASRLELIGIVNFLDDGKIEKIMEYGVSSLILKSNKLTEIEKALKITANRGSYLSAEIVKQLIVSNQKNLSSVLTRREVEVINLISRGKTYSMIATELNISVHTAKSHIKNIYSKLAVSTKAAAIAKAIEEKII